MWIKDIKDWASSASTLDYYLLIGFSALLIVTCLVAGFVCCQSNSDERSESNGGLSSTRRSRRRDTFRGSSASNSARTGLRTYGTDEEESLIGESPDDRALLETFRMVLSNGVDLLQHTRTGNPAKVRLTLHEPKQQQQQHERRQQLGASSAWLAWKAPGRPVNGKKHLPFTEVENVVAGKRGAGFRAAKSSLKGLSADQCLSLLTTGKDSLDLQAESLMEREALVQGFSMLLAAHRRKAP